MHQEPPSPAEIRDLLGPIDIYLFDQLMKGRIDPAGKILDAGCGGGRNLVYFLRSGAQVWGVDRNPAAIAQIRETAKALRPDLPASHFHCDDLEARIFEDDFFDLVVSNAVLHFMRDLGQFTRVVEEMWRVLRPGGLFFCRLGTTIGIEQLVVETAPGRFQVPDGSELFLVNLERLLEFSKRLGGELMDPIKTTNVQNLRCMTTWVLRKV